MMIIIIIVILKYKTLKIDSSSTCTKERNSSTAATLYTLETFVIKLCEYRQTALS